MPSTNVPPPFRGYRGSDPYLFISYAHADAALVFPELVQLRQWGANIWFDDGIDPGNEWPEEIAQGIGGANVVIFFVTPRSVRSSNCRNELNYALSLGKELLVIHLEETDLPPGVGLQISSIQAIMKHRMDADSYRLKLRQCLKKYLIDAEGAGLGIKVAVIDSGIEKSHPAFDGASFADDIAITSEENGPKAGPGEGIDVYGHGTAMAGLILERAPRVTLGSFRVLDSKLSGSHAVALAGFNLALEGGYHIIVFGLGSGLSPEYTLRYKDVVDRAFQLGIHLIGSANNEYEKSLEFPACFHPVIAVNMAKCVPPDHLYYRPKATAPYYALGVDTEVCWKSQAKKTVTGTSYAAARIGGTLAAILSQSGNCSPLEAHLLLQKRALPWTEAMAGRNYVPL